MAFAFKEIGFALNSDFASMDEQLTIIGSVSILCNGLSRYVWGYLADYFSFKFLITIVNVLIVISTFTIQLTSQNIVSYGFVIFICYVSIGSLFSLMPVLITKVFGAELFAKIYWIPFFGFTFGTISRFLCQILIINNIGGK